jgi:hypothetical protein
MNSTYSVTEKALNLIAALENDPALLRELQFYHSDRWLAACGAQREIDTLKKEVDALEDEAAKKSDIIDEYEHLTGPNLISLLGYAKFHLESVGYTEMAKHFDKAMNQLHFHNPRNHSK